jgi:hypothetical protein
VTAGGTAAGAAAAGGAAGAADAAGGVPARASTSGATAVDVVRRWCEQAGVEWEQTGPTDLVVVLPGEQKLRTTVSVSAGAAAITFNAFVMRHPAENVAAIMRWLLERNRRIFGLAYAIDQLGDIFLVGTLPARGLDEDAVDQLMGSVLMHADQVFNHLVEMGFESSIRAEWAWRLRAGESTANLAAFAHLAPPTQATDTAD